MFPGACSHPVANILKSLSNSVLSLFPHRRIWLPAALCGCACLIPPATAAEEIPPGAAALGCTKRIIDEHPAERDIAPEENGDYAWFRGQWYASPQPSDHFITTNGMFALTRGGELVSAPRDFSPGKLPLLDGSRAFYVEFDVRLSDDDPDHFPAVWLMPVEHNARQADHDNLDPAGYERWMEFDIDEGGFGPGLTGTVHNWRGIYPGFENLQNPNNVSKTPLDRSKLHTFGGSFDPRTHTVDWWVDGVRQMSAGSPFVPAVASRQHYYLILSAQARALKKPYLMFVSGVRAYAPPVTSPPER